MKHPSPTLLLLLLLAWACSSPSDPAVAAKKDCNNEYQELSSTPFASTTQALKRVDTYLNDFNNTVCPHLDDAQRLKELFEEMDLFFHNRQYDSYHAYLTAAMAARAVTGAEGVRCDALTFCMEPSQRRMRVCHVRGVCRM